MITLTCEITYKGKFELLNKNLGGQITRPNLI